MRSSSTDTKSSSGIALTAAVAVGLLLVLGGAAFFMLRLQAPEVLTEPADLVTAPAPTPAAAPSGASSVAAVVGRWRITSASNPGGGSTYRGSVDIGAASQDVATLTWQIPNSPPYSGTALLDVDDEQDVLGVGWGTGSNHGVVVYRIDGGTLRGRWAGAQTQGSYGTEVLEGPKELNGRYEITSSKSPVSGGSYTGSVTITPRGEVFDVHWTLAREQYRGVGIRRGNLLVVGWGIGGDSGAVLYTRANDGWQGVWAQPNGVALGSENLAR